METRTTHQDQVLFHLTGKLQGQDLRPIEGLQLCPALLAPYRELNTLRHDFPLVLVPGTPFVQPLSTLVNAVLRDVAPRGMEGERLRRHALQLERHIREAVAAGAKGTLSELWQAAAEALGQREGETLEQVLTHAGGALRADGEVLGCTPDMPARLLAHAWQVQQRAKTLQFRADLSRLVNKLSDVLRAAYSHSQIGRQPASLKAAVGGPHQDAFDFDLLSGFIGKGLPRDELPPQRHGRLVRTLGVLESQRFYSLTDGDNVDIHGFAFDNCAAAAQAFSERLVELTELVRALAVAELEVQGRYVESEHTPFFDAFDQHSLTAEDLARFPDYLVNIPADRNDAPENANLMGMLSSGLPVKVLVQTTDLFEESSIGTGHFAFGIRSPRLATTAMGLGGMFVLQTTSANLVALREPLSQGLACRGPALFSVFHGSALGEQALPPYLVSAAAMQSRAFPAFSYHAAAGGDWATRFSLQNNPQAEDDWPTETLQYADSAQQSASEPCAFTWADFALCDPRAERHFALVPHKAWTAAMLPAAQWLALDERTASQHVPYLWATDEKNVLQRVIVDVQQMQAARRCQLLWRRLQEHGGVHDSHAERLLAKEKAAWAAEQATQTPAPAAEAPAAAPAGAAPEHSRDEAWIETDRCPSCNECQLINDRMFTYNERKQAYIKDLSAGTYAQLVQAAESCQVAIIHPGKPRDDKEPGLAELLLRAEPFR